jgi:hypothetical protein
MAKMAVVYEWAVVVLAMAVVLITFGGIWFGFLDGQVVNIPVTFNAPHPYDYPVPKHNDFPSMEITHKTTKTSYKPGEMVSAYVDIVKIRPEPGRLQWQLMDKRFYPYVPRLGVVPVGHHHMVVQVEKIPLHVPPGQYHFSGSVVYDVNFLKSVYIPIRTNCFQVEAGKSDTPWDQ